MVSGDAGDLLQTIDQTSRIAGGALDLDAAVRQQYPSLDLGGTLRVNDFTLLEAPLLARLLTVASLTGIVNLLSGEGIFFDRFEMPFTYRQEVLAVERVRLSGSQLGLTAEGAIDLGRDQIDLSGTIVPIYGLNWVIGKIPVLGDFLRGSEGEGAFALTYTVERRPGRSDHPGQSALGAGARHDPRAVQRHPGGHRRAAGDAPRPQLRRVTRIVGVRACAASPPWPSLAVADPISACAGGRCRSRPGRPARPDGRAACARRPPG